MTVTEEAVIDLLRRRARAIDALPPDVVTATVAFPGDFPDAAAEASLATVNTNLGTDGAAPPVIAGTGVRGWLRAIYDKLVSGIAATVTGEVEVKNDAGNAIPISAASLPLPTGAATDAGLLSIYGAVDTLEAKIQSLIDQTDTVEASLTSIKTQQTDGTQKTKITDGVDDAEVNARTDGIKALEVNDDCTSFEAQHATLAGSTDTTITFAQPVRIVRVLNWDVANRVLVKDGAIASNTDATATRVGFAPTASVPGSRTLPFKTSSVHIRSAAASEITVEGFF